MKKAFTLVELLIVIIIIGILATMAIPQYNKMVEKAKAAEAYVIFDQLRKGYQALKKAAGESTAPGDWNPSVQENSNPSWEAVCMDNPNTSPSGYFSYDVWDDVFSQTHDPVRTNRYVIIAFRRKPTSGGAYAGYDSNKWLYMDIDTGEIFKSDTYK